MTSRRLVKSWKYRLQYDSADCAVACLDMVCAYYGASYSRHFLRQLCGNSREGTSVARILIAARHLGFHAKAKRMSFRSLMAYSEAPSIAWVSGDHYVIVLGMTDASVTLADPAVGKRIMSRKDFEASWYLQTDGSPYGIAVTFESDQVLPEPVQLNEPRRALLSTLHTHLPLLDAGTKTLLHLVVISTIVLGIQLGLPFFSAAMLNRIIALRSIHLITLLIVGQLAFYCGRLCSEYSHAIVLRRISDRVDTSLLFRMITKLLRLPTAFFDRRKPGELYQMVEEQAQLQQFVTGTFSQALLSFASLILFGFVLLYCNSLLFIIYSIGAGLFLMITLLFARAYRQINASAFTMLARRACFLADLFAGIIDLKLTCSEERVGGLWSDIQKSVTSTQFDRHRLASFQRAIGSLILDGTGLLVFAIALKSVVHGALTLGWLLAIQYILGQLASPINGLAGTLFHSIDFFATLDRTRDILEEPEESVAGTSNPPSPLVNPINFVNVSFGYYGSDDSRQVLRDITLCISPAKTTAIVGSSGSGKSTLLKLLMALHTPVSGFISIDDVALSHISIPAWRSKCGVVTQDGHLFSGPIAENIALGASRIDVDLVHHVCTIAQIHHFVLGLPRCYNTKIGREGIPLSKGQAQRILLARALYRKPALLLLDEATSSLDSETEQKLVACLESLEFKCTRVVVAHRLSTIRHADQIVVLDSGRIAEQGTHDELIGRGATYARLYALQTDTHAN